MLLMINSSIRPPSVFFGRRTGAISSSKSVNPAIFAWKTQPFTDLFHGFQAAWVRGFHSDWFGASRSKSLIQQHVPGLLERPSPGGYGMGHGSHGSHGSWALVGACLYLLEDHGWPRSLTWSRLESRRDEWLGGLQFLHWLKHQTSSADHDESRSTAPAGVRTLDSWTRGALLLGYFTW